MSRPLLLRRALLVALVIASGSRALADAYEWDAVPTHKPLPAQVYYVDAETIAYMCHAQPYTSHSPAGCAVRDYAAGVCSIYVDGDGFIPHEKKHCDGYDHKPWQPTPQWVINIRR